MKNLIHLRPSVPSVVFVSLFAVTALALVFVVAAGDVVNLPSLLVIG